MAKKQVKKVAKKSKALKPVRKVVKKSAKSMNLKLPALDISNKLDRVLAIEDSILKEEQSVEDKEDRLEQEEQVLKGIEEKAEQNEAREESELQKLEALEQEIKTEVGAHPLVSVTLKDVVKGLIGAFIGLSVHYTFTYGVEISERLTMPRATVLYVLAFVVGLLFIYATGFRKIKDPKILVFMPIRLIILYIASILMSILILYIFYPTFGHDFTESYKQVGGVLLAAVIGACTADLIGKD